MNELIRELAEQAGIKIQYDHDSEMCEFGGDAVCVLEEFAELIVRECANQCLSDDCMRILNHMGVKYE